MVRIPEQNDWVVYILFGSISVVVLTLLYLHREASLKDFLLQERSNVGNKFPTWIIFSVLNVVLIATLAAQYIPSVPRAINNFSILGFSLNKFGFACGAMALYYVLRSVFTYLFFASVGQDGAWYNMFFTAMRYYLVLCIIWMVFIFVSYFFPINRVLLINVITLFIPVAFVFKNALYLFSRVPVLPSECYYKFLYICTLQIAPLLALCRLLFF